MFNRFSFNGTSVWFYSIAALTLVNTFLLFVGGDITFVLGLAIAQLTDGFFGFVLEMPALAVIFSLVLAGAFAALGYFAQKSRVVLVIGVAAYVVDVLLLAGMIVMLEADFSTFILDFALRAYVIFVLAKSAFQPVQATETNIATPAQTESK